MLKPLPLKKLIAKLKIFKNKIQSNDLHESPSLKANAGRVVAFSDKPWECRSRTDLGCNQARDPLS